MVARRSAWALPLMVIAAGCAVSSGRVVLSARAASSHPKRGIASTRYLRTQPEILSQLGAAWAYDWGARTPSGAHPQWVPMVWGPGSMSRATIASLTVARKAGRARDLLSFNEPDSSAQANMTPMRAAHLWPALESTGLELGAPAPAVATDGWLAAFMAIAAQRHLRVDFLTLHYEQDFTNPDAVGELKRQLIAIYDRYRKPIWITEIGALDIRKWNEPMLRPPTKALASAYMRELFPMLDALPFVQRYAWFTDRCLVKGVCRSDSLVDPSGQLTPAGRTFETAR